MTDTTTTAITPTPPSDWELLSRGDKGQPTYYVDDWKVLFTNELDPTEWDHNVLATLIGQPDTNKLNPVHERRIYLVFPNVPLAHLDGFGLSWILGELARYTGYYITLATYGRETKQLPEGVSDKFPRRLVTYDNREMNQPGVLIELCTQEFFRKHTNPDMPGLENERLRWEALYNRMAAITADGDYSSDPFEVLGRGLFHQERYVGSNHLVVVRRGTYGLDMSPPLPIYNVKRRR